ncbi:hypothetical protein D3C72_1577030 [compost metagenome]
MICPSTCSELKPLPVSPEMALVAALLPGFTDSTSCAWCSAARLSHSVVAIEVPMAPAVMRRKFDSPDAAGMRSGVRPDSVMVTSGMKKNAIAMPWMIVGMMIVTKSACVLKFERIHSTSANTRNEKVA